MKKTFSIISLGCPRNLVDSESIMSEFKKRGYAFKDSALGVDTVIINTCAFIEDAKKESIDTILKVIDAKKEGSVRKIIVAGCLPERYEKELREELRGVDEFRKVLSFGDREFQRDLTSRLTPRHYAYIKISEGCANRCTYCIIPFLKGPYRSKAIELIIDEARGLMQKGAKELVLVGQDVSLYGVDLYGKKRLAELLQKLSRVAGKNWIRLLYCHPANLGKDVINIIRDNKNICKYIDLPIEHISDNILKRMGRKIKKKDIVSLITYIRKILPDVALRTSIIVGFPGETNNDFKELLSFIKEIRFERLGLFRYSREEGTPAYGFKSHIAESEKEARFDEIMSLQQNISSDINQGFKGRTLRVLIDEKKEDYYMGRTEYDAPEVDGAVYVRGEDVKVGDFCDVRITDSYEYDLVGQV